MKLEENFYDTGEAIEYIKNVESKMIAVNPAIEYLLHKGIASRKAYAKGKRYAKIAFEKQNACYIEDAKAKDLSFEDVLDIGRCYYEIQWQGDNGTQCGPGYISWLSYAPYVIYDELIADYAYYIECARQCLLIQEMSEQFSKELGLELKLPWA